MGQVISQVISSSLRWLVGKVKTVKDEKDRNTSLISHPQCQSYYINISPDNDTEFPRNYSPPIIFPSTESNEVVHEMRFSDTDNRDMHSCVVDKSSMMLCSGQDEVYVEDEIKDVVISNDNYNGTENTVDLVKETAVISKVIVLQERRIGPYKSSQKILLVGEGNFSFSASLGMAFTSAVNILATSLDSQEFLRNNYTRAIGNISKLRERGGTVLHGVDCTKMVNMFINMRFDRIIYNFPHSGFNNRNGPREVQLIQHRKLVRGFLANAKKLMNKEFGEIHIRHKSCGFYKDWNLRSLAYEEGLLLLEEANFNLREYPGYHTMYGFGGNASFNCFPSKTYKFGLPNN